MFRKIGNDCVQVMDIKALMSLKGAVNAYLKKADYSGEFARVAMAALERAGFKDIYVFDHEYDGKKQLVMINMNAPASKLTSGVILNENGEIEKFQTSEDYKSVSVNALARCLILESIDDDSDILRLRSLAQDKCSWIIHYVNNEINKQAKIPQDKWFPMHLCNAHTHGLSAFDHRDFQVVLDIGQGNTGYILNALAERVRGGEIFKDGEMVEGIWESCAVKLVIAKEGNREVFRVMIPDDNNKFPGHEGCKYPYSEQDWVIE